MKTLKLLLCIVPMVVLSSYSAEKVFNVNFDPEAYELELDDTLIISRYRISAFVANYGEPDRKVAGPDGITQQYYYEEKGMSVEVRYGSVRAIRFTFNPDGDTNFTQKAFSGNFKFGVQTIDSETKQSDLLKVKGFFDCRAHGCFSKNMSEAVYVIVGFEKSGKKRISYIIFGIRT